MNKLRIRLFLPLLLLIYSVTYGSCRPLYYDPEWSALVYWGKMTEDNLGQVLRLNYTLANDTLYSLEFGHVLSKHNSFKRYLQPIVPMVEFMANFTVLDDAVYGPLYEINPYFAFRWNRFPWQNFLCTSIALGEGVSYVNRVPYTEQLHSDETKKFLNFLLFEITFALPSCPQFEIVARIHHRSGAFGFYHANNSGSTAVGLAIRYRF